MSVPSNLPGIPADEYPSPAQFTTPVDDGYAALIGQATYAWTYLEWQVVCIGEKISPGFVHVATPLTAGNMGKELANELKAFVGDPTLATELTTLASDFDVLVKRRNKLLHGHPATLHGKQRLHYWSPKKIKQTGVVSVEVFDWEPNELVTFRHDVEALARVATCCTTTPHAGPNRPLAEDPCTPNWREYNPAGLQVADSDWVILVQPQ